jgi:hypothetical protein
MVSIQTNHDTINETEDQEKRNEHDKAHKHMKRRRNNNKKAEK